MPCSSQELAALEALGQLLTNGLLDDAGPREADERLGLRDVQVAEHREAGRHAAGRRIGEDGDVGQPGAVQPRQRRRHLRHLHQRQRAFHHPRAAGARHDDDRLAPLQRHLDGARDLLAGHDAHAAADERVLHRRDHDVECRRAVPVATITASLSPVASMRLQQALAVRLGVGEPQRIVRAQVRRSARCTARHRTAPPAARRRSSEVVGALGADAQVRFEVLLVDRAGCSPGHLTHRPSGTRLGFSAVARPSACGSS